jgi:hypothetical protein
MMNMQADFIRMLDVSVGSQHEEKGKEQKEWQARQVDVVVGLTFFRHRLRS